MVSTTHQYLPLNSTLVSQLTNSPRQPVLFFQHQLPMPPIHMLLNSATTPLVSKALTLRACLFTAKNLNIPHMLVKGDNHILLIIIQNKFIASGSQIKSSRIFCIQVNGFTGLISRTYFGKPIKLLIIYQNQGTLSPSQQLSLTWLPTIIFQNLFNLIN